MRLFPALVFFVTFQVPVGVPRLHGALVGIHRVIQILLIDRIAHARGLDLLTTASVCMVSSGVLTRRTPTDGRAARKRTRLRPIVVLLLLVFVEARALQATLDVTLRFSMMTVHTLVESDCFSDRYQFRQHMLLGKVTGCGTSRR